MPETMQTTRTIRFDVVEPQGGSKDLSAASVSPAVNGPAISARREGAGGLTIASWASQWSRAIRTLARGWMAEMGTQGASFGVAGHGTRRNSFESMVHEFASVIDAAETPGSVEASLVRQAQRLLPAYRIALIVEPVDDLVPMPRGNGQVAYAKPSHSDIADDQRNDGALEMHLRGGSTMRRRLCIRPRLQETVVVRDETAHRLRTLCALSACALERLDRDREWPKGDTRAISSDFCGSRAETSGLATSGADANASQLHDATFLNAVLPFALEQARRHREPVSLVCVAIDRLSGIRELLGSAAVDRLVRSVGHAVAGLIRTSDIVVRLDDDRVVAVLPRAYGGGALYVAQKIRDVVAGQTHEQCDVPNITVSIGVATFPTCADNAISLFEAVDRGVAHAQSQGRNRACLAPRRTARTSCREVPAGSQAAST